MRSCLIAGLLVLTALSVALNAEPQASVQPAEQALQRFMDHNRAERLGLRDVSMKVDIEASLPGLQKEGKLSALRSISKLGKITYNMLEFVGDNMIKKDVIARYIKAEVEAASNGHAKAMAISAANYRFHYHHTHADDYWKLHLFRLEPRRKEVGLFSGWMWIEDSTGLPVRESGRLVKSPSVFLSKIEFMRDYEPRDGIAVPTRVESKIETRLVGVAELRIRFRDVSFENRPAQIASRQFGDERNQ